MFAPLSFLTLVIISSMMFSSLNSTTFMGNETDKVSLLAFKDGVTDPLGLLNSWNKSTHFCEWYGVTCGRRHQRITVLDLHSSRLAGSLSPHLGNLSFLKILSLVNNSFSRNIPQELGRLRRLKFLRLTNNTLSGEIPINISQCSNLRELFLSGNNLAGKLPVELSLLVKLEKFSFYRNQISGGIPPSLGNLSSLQGISATRNSLNGVIPESFRQLMKLTHLSLGENNLTGVIPYSLFNLTSLISFSVESNQLEGTLPSDWGLFLPNIKIFEGAANRLNGKIPVTISNASKLSVFELNVNKFTGKVPPLVGLDDLKWVGLSSNYFGYGEDDDLNFLSHLINCSNLELLQIHSNNFGGILPEYISNFSTRLKRMTLGENQIRGHLPDGIRNLISLEDLGLEWNKLTGTIPASLGDLPNLRLLLLDLNELSGTIPNSLGNLTSLLMIDLGGNNLHGSIPTSLVHWKNILFINLENNKLSGKIPREIMKLSSLSIQLDLADNQFTGSIPLEVGELLSLGSLYLSNNLLSGEIPETLGNCISLENLDLYGNSLQGSIPESLSSLRGIQHLDLSRNNFSGKILKFLGDLGLKDLNLSMNDFEGEVPTQGVFKNASAVSLLGNKKLCGGMPQLKLPRCTFNVSKRSKPSTKFGMIIGVTSGMLLLGLILLFSFISFCRSRKTKHSIVSMSSAGTSFPRITYGDLFKATDGFSSSNLLGVGGFGNVYKGILNQGGIETVVAVKVLKLHQRGALKSFMAECEALRNIRHRNLVTTLTVCSSTDFSNNDFKAMVYEFMVNCNLEEWLHPVHMIDHSQDQSRFLDLVQRLNIAIDVASALEYLHNQCSQLIVHRDLKPSNVLLNNDMTACIGDFGLARLLPEAFNHLSSNESSSTGFKGSIGYAAPEYATRGEVSTSGDVYSYGIILLEMFTRKRPTDEMFKDGLNLVDFVKTALPDGIVKVVDPILLHDSQNRIGSNDQTLACFSSIFKVGLACSAEMPRDRMNITEVAAQLNSIRRNILGTRRRDRL